MRERKREEEQTTEEPELLLFLSLLCNLGIAVRENSD